ncbi:GNAT family N-acetyltransferase [Amycolatopsis acidiphila]|uniref:GNAT family N-acetyltransferase n=1 Tax=Amycolatopsis acidiphila TaxID=715473 RepID=A0A558A6B9_9PSEU|nr:GNAT family N-acetyltransferase [Amycolatopsis acidiphila]
MRLLPLGAAAIRALADGDLTCASRAAPVPLTPYFVQPEWIAGWRRARDRIEANPAAVSWLADVVWDEVQQAAVGRAGFHGPPDALRRVEVTYEVEPAHRRRGHARAALESLQVRALADPGVRLVRAVIRPHNVASRRLVAQCGFVELPAQDDVPGGPWVVYGFEAG